MTVIDDFAALPDVLTMQWGLERHAAAHDHPCWSWRC